MLVERTDRGDQMFLTMASRHARHALDLDAAAVIDLTSTWCLGARPPGDQGADWRGHDELGVAPDDLAVAEQPLELGVVRQVAVADDPQVAAPAQGLAGR